MKKCITGMVALCVAAALVGCEKKAEPVDDGATSSGELPAALFVATAPAGARPLVEAKANAQAGERIVFEARVGGRPDPFVDGRAVFFVADPSLVSCDEMEMDEGCKTPWDYCCEPPDNLLRHMATVQVVDAEGQPIKVSLRNHNGLEPLKTIIVAGTVSERDDAGSLVVNAESIHIRGG